MNNLGAEAEAESLVRRLLQKDQKKMMVIMM